MYRVSNILYGSVLSLHNISFHSSILSIAKLKK
jgi:hypothetical protein